jgi:hypothetical protein
VRKHDNWTDLQKLYRQRLSKIAQLWRSLPPGLVKQTWNQVSPERNGYASFVKTNMSALQIDGTLTDPTQLTLTDGKLMPVQLLKAVREAPSSNSIKVSWQNDKNSPRERMDDALMALTFTGGYFSALTDTGLKRADQSGTFPFPPPLPWPRALSPCFYSCAPRIQSK